MSEDEPEPGLHSIDHYYRFFCTLTVIILFTALLQLQ
jgi:hypothetical protein